MTSKARYVGYAGAGLCLLGILLEAGLRLGLGLGTPPLLRADSTIGYVFRANQDTDRFTNRVHINGYHQRSEDLMAAPDSTFVRMLFLGDSVTWGGVLTDQSETIPEATEHRLARRCGQPVEALNASVGSWGLGNLHAYVDRFGLFESDVVVLQIGTHDLTQATSDASVVGHDPSYPNEYPWLATEELVERYLWPRYIRPHLPELRGAGSSQAAKASSTLGPDARFARNLDHLRVLVERARMEAIPIVILHTPNRWEVVGQTEGAEASSRRRQFLRVAESLDVPVLNLAQKWARRSGVRSFYRDHIHLNERGNAAVADTLTDFLGTHHVGLCSGRE